MKIIKKEYGFGKQSVELNLIIESENGLKIKVGIDSDSYDFQSSARVSVFNQADLQWKTISSIHYSKMKTPIGLNSYPPNQKTDELLDKYFKSDVNVLLKEAELLLNINLTQDNIKSKKTTIKPK